MNDKLLRLYNNLPDFEIPKGFENADSYIRDLTINGLKVRYSKEKQADGKAWEKMKERAEYELNIIIHYNFANYFLIVMDYVNWAIKQNIPVGPGRGSAPSSIVAYALHITDIDPIKFNLIFERSINPEHGSIPDFDIDFSDEGRNDVINYVKEKYGKECVKNIFVFSKNNTSQKPSIHASGLIIAKKDIIHSVPFSFPDENINSPTPYGFNDLENNGLIRFDFLGLKVLDILKYTSEIIRLRGGNFSEFQLGNIPENDEKTFKMLGQGNSSGIFWFESDGIKNVLKKVKPKNINDLAAISSLYRPGLIDLLPQFIEARNNGKEGVKYMLPEFEDILKETYGIIVYQEQVIQIIHCITGYSLGKADHLRRIFHKFLQSEIDQEKKKFITSAIEKGYPEKTVENILDSLIPSARLAFPKSHAVAYSYLAYQEAYLKANFSKEFKMSLNKYSNMQ